MKRAYSSILSLIAVVALCAAGALARGQASTPQAPAQSKAQPASNNVRETDIGLSFYEAMNSTTTAMGVTQTPTNSPGGMFELRHIHSSFIGYEFSYSYNPADQTVTPAPAPACGSICNTPPQKLPSKGSTVGLAWVISKKFGALRPFAVGGLGFFIDQPAYSVTVGQTATLTNEYPLNDVVRPAWIYGGGVDFAISQHLGFRAQYRGVIYHVPNISDLYPAQGVYTQTGMPLGGIFYAF